MRILQVAICQSRFEPGDNQLCSSPPEVAVDSAFFLAIFSSNSESPAWFLNKLVKILRYSSDHRRDLIIFMAHETYRSDVRKKIGSYQVESAEQKKRTLKRDVIEETVPLGLTKLDAMDLNKQHAHRQSLLGHEQLEFKNGWNQKKEFIVILTDNYKRKSMRYANGLPLALEI